MHECTTQKSILQDCSFTSSLVLKEKKLITGIQGERQQARVYYLIPQTKQAVRQWKHPTTHTAKKFKVCQTAGKLCHL